MPYAYMRRGTGVSIVINVVLSLAFFLLIFGLGGTVGVWWPSLLTKLVFCGILAAIVIPIGLRATLGLR